MHKAFIDNKPLIFENVYHELTIPRKDYLILSEAEFSLDDVINKLIENKTTGVIYLCARLDQTWNEFTARYTVIEAAGGVVKNAKDKLLVIFRKKLWDLPKGKLEYDETPEDAAVREVKEECGLMDLKIDSPLIRTFHTYSDNDKSVLKKTHWFRMSSSDTGKPVAQQEEDIEKAKWMTKEKIYKKVIPETYASIQEVLELYFSKR